MMQAILQNIAFIFASLISLGLLGSGVWVVWKISKRDSEILENDKKMLENQTKIFQEIDVFKKQMTKVCDIVGYQFQKNGGGSTTDKIDRIESTLNGIAERQILDFYLDDQPKYECDENGFCTRVNYAWRKVTGLSEEDALGDRWVLSIHPRHRELVKKHWDSFIENSIPFEFDYIIVNPVTRKEFLVKGRAIRKCDNHGLKLIVGTFEIIKEYKNESVKMASGE